MTTIPTTVDDRKIIDKMKRQSLLLLVVTLIVFMAVVLLGSPSTLIVKDKTVMVNKGLPTFVLVILCVAVFVAEFLLARLIARPVRNALDKECDPRKHFVLRKDSLRTRGMKLRENSTDYLYLGYFASLFECTDKMTASRSATLRLCGLFNKARGSFFKDDRETLKGAMKQFEEELAGKQRFGKRKLAIFDNWLNVMRLLDGIMEKDVDACGRYRSLEPWNKSKMAKGYFDFIKGLAAKVVGDNEEAAAMFRSVSETCRKNILGGLADRQLNEEK